MGSKKLNADQKRARRAGDLAKFVQQYGRKIYPQLDPNDRHCDGKVERLLKRIPAEELDRLLRDDEI